MYLSYGIIWRNGIGNNGNNNQWRNGVIMAAASTSSMAWRNSVAKALSVM